MKILCVGSNYRHHVKEMGSPDPATPTWFWKPASAIIGDGDAVELPPESSEVHHEVELAVRIGADARRLPDPAAGRDVVDAFTVAVDVTARDLQRRAKEEGRPWAMAKGFDTFLPLGSWQEASGRDLQDLDLLLGLDGAERQRASTSGMTWGVGTLVHLASQWVTLRRGDVLLTGTPQGVGPVSAGQEMVAEVVGHVRLRNPVVAGAPLRP